MDHHIGLIKVIRDICDNFCINAVPHFVNNEASLTYICSIDNRKNNEEYRHRLELAKIITTVSFSLTSFHKFDVTKPYVIFIIIQSHTND